MNGTHDDRFVSHRLIRGGHLQTIVGGFAAKQKLESSVRWNVALSDGDQVVLHEDRPLSMESPCAKAAILVHGLAGCHSSGYMQRIAHRLIHRGVRVFRMDMRGCGAGAKLASRTVHAGRTDDLLTAIQFVRKQFLIHDLTLVGFSLGAAISLLLAGNELTSHRGELVDRIVAVSPPIDLAYCCSNLSQGWNVLYDRYFVRRLVKIVRQSPNLVDANRCLTESPTPKSLKQFDQRVTAPLGGFDGVDQYYDRCSPKPHLKKITIPTLIITSHDDPIVPVKMFDQVDLARKTVQIHVTPGGGHLGFVAAKNSIDPDRHWIDWRVVDFVTNGGSHIFRETE